MARKTYHHLVEGDHVVAEKVLWDGKSEDLTVQEQRTSAKVMEVGVKTLKLQVGWRTEDIAVISRQGGIEWGSQIEHGCWRIAPVFGRAKGSEPKPYVPPKCLPSVARMHTEYEVYPGQPLVSAACIVAIYRSPEEAALPCFDRDGKKCGWCDAEGRSEIPGAGGQASKAVEALLGYRHHRSVDQVVADLHQAWRDTVGGGNFDDRYEPGMEKARALEPVFREALTSWLGAR